MRLCFYLIQTKKSFPLELRQKTHASLLNLLWSRTLEQSDVTTRKDFSYRIRASQHFFNLLIVLFELKRLHWFKGKQYFALDLDNVTTFDLMLAYFPIFVQYPAFIPLAFQQKNGVIFRPAIFLHFYEKHRALFFLSLNTLKILILVFVTYRLYHIFNQKVQPFLLSLTLLYRNGHNVGSH